MLSAVLCASFISAVLSVAIALAQVACALCVITAYHTGVIGGSVDIYMRLNLGGVVSSVTV